MRCVRECALASRRGPGGKASECHTRVAQEAMLSAPMGSWRARAAAGGQSGAGVNAGGAAATGVLALAVEGLGALRDRLARLHSGSATLPLTHCGANKDAPASPSLMGSWGALRREWGMWATRWRPLGTAPPPRSPSESPQPCPSLRPVPRTRRAASPRRANASDRRACPSARDGVPTVCTRA